MKLITRQGFDFVFDPKACERCQSLCCRGASGNIWVTFHEVQVICKVLNTNLIDGMEHYFKRVGNRFSIREICLEEDCPCVFLEPGKGCSIYAVRPVQCRTFPFWNHFKTHFDALVDQCPGIVMP